jgi:FkbM family methyltransferase
MNVTDQLTQKYLEWRKRALPPSVADIEWRHEFIASRLEQIERAISNQFPETLCTPALQAEILKILRLLEPKKVVGHKKIRVGSVDDGGYVQIDDIEGISHALSFGISDNDSWDLAMAESGVPVEQFDHSVENAPSNHPLLQFHRKIISVDARADSATLPDLTAEHSKSASTPDLILKMDIEGCEWEVFDQAPGGTLSHFSQIMCEFHDFSRLTNFEFRDCARRVFEKLDKYFAPVHIHGNNCAALCNVCNIPLPDVIEITFANRGRYTFEECNETYPTPLDAPNAISRPDFALGTFKF